MQKKCLIYLKEEMPAHHDIKPSLAAFDVDVIFFQKQTDFTKWSEANNPEDVALIIYKGENDYFRNDIQKEFINSFIMWIHPNSHPGYYKNSYTGGYKSIDDAYEFLKSASESSKVSSDFEKRVPLLSHKNEAPSDKGTTTNIQNHKTTDQEKNGQRRLKEGDSPIPQQNIHLHSQIGELKQQEAGRYTTKKVQYQENPFYLRTRKLQKELFMNQKWGRNKTIGIWSPLHKTGVTTFTLNFAFFLADNRIRITVLEGLTEKYAMKEWLQRYTEVPSKWVSYAKAIHDEEVTHQANWIYRNVMFLPLDYDDANIQWNAFSIEAYMRTPNIVDVTLVDFPTGNMADYTRKSLDYIDELWVVVNDIFQETLAWRNYIQDLKSQFQIPIYLIFNEVEEFSQTKRLAKELGMPLLTTLPTLYQEVKQNYYEISPIYFKEEIATHLNPPFIKLAKHLCGNDFILFNEDMKKQNKWWFHLLRPLKILTGNGRINT